jgi:hypothetical protein
MSEQKFTPGPWVNHGRITQPGIPHSAVAAEMLIARVYSKHFGDSEQEIANANLIAAAPELLEALKAVLKDEEWNAAMADEVTPGARDNIRKARAAIAKAEGQS